jgi:hypothetical protein
MSTVADIPNTRKNSNKFDKTSATAPILLAAREIVVVCWKSRSVLVPYPASYIADILRRLPEQICGLLTLSMMRTTRGSRIVAVIDSFDGLLNHLLPLY